MGVTFDNKLSWKPHIKNIQNKISRGCWALANIKSFVDQSTLRMIYFSLIYSHLNYGIVCWGSVYKTNLTKLLSKQNWAVRIITNSDRLDSSSPLFHKTKILKLHDIFKLKIATEVKRIINNNKLHNYLLSYLHSIHSYQTRSSSQHNLSIPIVKTDIGKTLFKYQGPSVWNQIPIEIRVKPLLSLKNSLKNYLINTYTT